LETATYEDAIDNEEDNEETDECSDVVTEECDNTNS
jgi:hypothetical protein